MARKTDLNFVPHLYHVVSTENRFIKINLDLLERSYEQTGEITQDVYDLEQYHNPLLFII
jgi:hypothetical protein